MARRRLRLLVLTPDFPPARGGIQTLVHRLVVNMPGVSSRVLALDEAGAGAFDASGALDVRRVPNPSGRRRDAISLLNALAPAEAFRFRPDVVLSGHIVTGPAATAIRALLRRPVVQYVYAKEIRARPRLAARSLRHADAVVAISRYARELALGAGAAASKITLIPPGVDLPAPVRFPPPPSARPPSVISVARLEDRYKGHDVIMRALPLVLAKVPDVRWRIVGEGPLRGCLEELAAVHGLTERVHFAGSVSDAERDRLFAASRVLAMPSRLPARGLAGEGFGIVYLEAGARGLPVVAGNVAGVPDAVVDGTTGLLVDPNDHVQVAEALVALLRDDRLADRLAAGGRARAPRFAWPVIGRRVEALLREVSARA